MKRIVLAIGVLTGSFASASSLDLCAPQDLQARFEIAEQILQMSNSQLTRDDVNEVFSRVVDCYRVDEPRRKEIVKVANRLYFKYKTL